MTMKLEDRSKYVGASEIAVVCGISPWKTPYKLFREKTGLDEREPPSQFMEWGIKLEPVILQKYADMHDTEVIDQQRAFKKGNVVCHIDGYDRKHNRLTEAKTVNAFAKEWDDEIPDYYHVQCLAQIELVQPHYPDLKECLVSVLKGGNTYAEHIIKRDEELGQKLITKADHWFKAHILNNVAPDTETTSDILAKYQFGGSNKSIIQATADTITVLNKIEQYQAQERGAKSKLDELKNSLRMMMGDCTHLQLHDQVLATWTQSKPRTRTDWKQVVEKLVEKYQLFTHEDIENIIADCTSQSKPTRTLRIK